MRVGGRSNSEILKRFNLRELTHSPNFRNSLPRHLRCAYNEVSSHCLNDAVTLITKPELCLSHAEQNFENL